MPRGKRETRFFLFIEERESTVPQIYVFDSVPRAKGKVAELEVELYDRVDDHGLSWGRLPDGRWALLIKGYNLPMIRGRLIP